MLMERKYGIFEFGFSDSILKMRAAFCDEEASWSSLHEAAFSPRVSRGSRIQSSFIYGGASYVPS
jgi:hypothetical protein